MNKIPRFTGGVAAMLFVITGSAMAGSNSKLAISSRDTISSDALVSTKETTSLVRVDKPACPPKDELGPEVIPITIVRPPISIGPVKPFNDDFASAMIIDGLEGSVEATNVGATQEQGEPFQTFIRDTIYGWRTQYFHNTPGKTGMTKSLTDSQAVFNEPTFWDGHELDIRRKQATTTLWWEWTAPIDGDVMFEAIGNGFDTMMGVYAEPNNFFFPDCVSVGATLGNILKVAADDAGDCRDNGNGWGLCIFPCRKGVTYYICVAGCQGASGDLILNWEIDSHARQLW